jgi:hypothetical protein
VKDILIQQGLDKALNGEARKSEGMKDNEWKAIESKCVSTIYLHIVNSIINNVVNEETTPELWVKMKNLYLAKSLSNELLRKQELYKLKMEEGGNLMNYMNFFNGLINQL